MDSHPANGAHPWLFVGWLGWLLVASACTASAGSPQDTRAAAPTPVTRAARTAASLASPTPLPRLPTAAVFADPATGRPVWPTPPASCPVSPIGAERPDLGPTMGESPLWLASQVLPVVPWRNDFIRSVWVVERSTDGDLILSGRRTDAPGVAQFVRPGGESATQQLRISSAGRIGSPTASPAAARYADNQVYIVLPGTGCWEVSARLGNDVQRTFTFYVYN